MLTINIDFRWYLLKQPPLPHVNVYGIEYTFIWPLVCMAQSATDDRFCHAPSTPWATSFYSLLTVISITGSYEVLATLPISVGLQEIQPRLFHSSIPTSTCSQLLSSQEAGARFPYLRFPQTHLVLFFFFLSSLDPEPPWKDRENHSLLPSDSFSRALSNLNLVCMTGDLFGFFSCPLPSIIQGNKLYATISLEYFSFSLKPSKHFFFKKPHSL